MTPPSDPIDRRRFLAVLAGLAAAGCTPDVTTSTPTTSAPKSTGSETTNTAAATSSESTPTAQAPADPAGLEPLPTSPLDIDSDPFVLGVASGDPDSSTVVLWTRLIHPDLPEEVELVWEVAGDESFTTINATGTVTATGADAHTVRALAGDFGVNRDVHYRFRAGSFTSPAGRTRTLPETNDFSDPISLAFSSCQLMETGHFAAHRDIAAADVDIVVWLGDYIYEGGGSSNLDGRSHVPATANDLESYRSRYAQYRSDAHLRAAHAAHPWLVFWDDHEVVNDYDSSADGERRLAAYRAWWEHMPTRLPRPTTDGLTVHRSFDLGGLASLHGLDVRQYATSSTLLGDDQWRWLDGALRRAERGSTWTIVASPVLLSGLITSLDADAEPLLGYSFDGYPDERARLAELLGLGDSIVVSGDLHTGMVLDARPEPRAPASSTVAPEFMAPAISSAFPPEFATEAQLLPLVNPQMREIDIANGWLRLDLTADTATATFRIVEDVRSPDSPVSDGSRWSVQRGNPIAELS